MSEKNITTTFTGVHVCYDAGSWITPGAYYGIGYYYSDTYVVGYYSFTTPSFSGSSKSIQFSLEIGNGYTDGVSYDIKINYAICTSDLNKNMYCNTCNSVIDEYQIASGIWEITSLPYDLVTRELLVESNKIKSGKEYYLFFWGAEEKDDCCRFRSHYNYLSDFCVNITYSSANVNIYTKNDSIIHANSYIALSNDSQNEQLAFVPATPYICVKKYYDWEGLFQGTVTGTLYLRQGPGTSYSTILSMPKSSVVTAYEIAIGDNGDPWARVKYNSSEGWCSTRYLTYTAYARVINPNGARQYGFGTANTVEYSTVFPYGSEIIISTDNSGSDLAFRQEEDYDSTDIIIWCHSIHSEKNEDGSVSNMYGYVKLSDIELLSERTVFEWKEAIA